MLRRAPRSEYLAFDDHPANIVVYTDRLEMHKNSRRENCGKKGCAGVG